MVKSFHRPKGNFLVNENFSMSWECCFVKINFLPTPDRSGILFSIVLGVNPRQLKKDLAHSGTGGVVKNSVVVPKKNYKRPCLISSTISGFKSVVVSPKLEKSPSAIFRKMRRIIFPERVLGNPFTN